MRLTALICLRIKKSTFSPIYINFVLAAKAVSRARTLKERQELIKQGLATPFSFQARKPSSSTLKLDDTFSTFLDASVGRDPKSAQKSNDKIKAIKRKNEDADEAPKQQVRKLEEVIDEYKPSTDEESEGEVSFIT